MKQKTVDWSTCAIHKSCEDLLQQLQGEKEIESGVAVVQSLNGSVCQLIMLKKNVLLF